VKARNPEYTKGYKAGMQQGFRLARKTFGDVVDLAIADVLGASPEQIRAVERKANRLLANVLGGYVGLDDVAEAWREEIGE
jgi:hypothetical protein